MEKENRVQMVKLPNAKAWVRSALCPDLELETVKQNAQSVPIRQRTPMFDGVMLRIQVR
jgi:hypothetical protein